MRVACPSQDDADALAEIAKHSQIPVIADIHFQPKYVFAAIEAGCAAVRVNPGNIRAFDDQVKPFTGNNDDAVRIVREILAFASSGTCHKVEGAIHPDRPHRHDMRTAVGPNGSEPEVV